MPSKQKETLTKVTFKIPKELDEALELTAHQWRMQKREAVIILLGDGLKFAGSNRSFDGQDLSEEVA